MMSTKQNWREKPILTNSIHTFKHHRIIYRYGASTHWAIGYTVRLSQKEESES